MNPLSPNRFWGSSEPREFPRFANDISSSSDGAQASFRIYGPIDDWGGMWGVSAAEVAEALGALPATVTTINLHINSPGGLIFEGIAIKNLLANHSARVVAHVDGLAASIASVIAVGAADELVMGQDSHLMIHDGSTYTWGNAADLRAAADLLDTLSDSIAGVYARKAGGTQDEWRDTMRGERWYTADDAVSAGLADRVANAAPDDEAPDDEAAAARWDRAAVAQLYATSAPPEAPLVADTPPDDDPHEAPVTPGLSSFQAEAERLRLALLG